MKLAITTTTDTGKRSIAAANEYIDIDITAGNRALARLRVALDTHGYYAITDEGGYNIMRHYCKTCQRWYASDDIDPCDIPF